MNENIENMRRQSNDGTYTYTLPVHPKRNIVPRHIETNVKNDDNMVYHRPWCVCVNHWQYDMGRRIKKKKNEKMKQKKRSETKWNEKRTMQQCKTIKYSSLSVFTQKQSRIPGYTPIEWIKKEATAAAAATTAPYQKLCFIAKNQCAGVCLHFVSNVNFHYITCF